MNIQKLDNINSVILSEEEMINVLGGENKETITDSTNPGTQNPDKCNKCDKCDKCMICL